MLAAVRVGERSTERVLGREIWLGGALLEHCWSCCLELGCGFGCGRSGPGLAGQSSSGEVEVALRPHSYVAAGIGMVLCERGATALAGGGGGVYGNTTTATRWARAIKATTDSGVNGLTVSERAHSRLLGPPRA